jgi:hypothetical protein
MIAEAAAATIRTTVIRPNMLFAPQRAPIVAVASHGLFRRSDPGDIVASRRYTDPGCPYTSSG